MNPSPIVVPLSEASLSIELIGGKALNLAKMVQADLPVPSGFVVSTRAYGEFIRSNNIDTSIDSLLKDYSSGDRNLVDTSNEIDKLFRGAGIASATIDEILRCFRSLKDERRSFAVRSSANIEDLPTSSFAGQQESFLNVWDEEDLVDSIRKCWASLWSPRAIVYREKFGISSHQAKMAVIIQELINAQISGVAFTCNPTTGAREEFVINSSYGLGESIVSGAVTPDMFILNKSSLEIKAKRLGTKKILVQANQKSNLERVVIAHESRNKYSITDELLSNLGKFLIDVESHFKLVPQDIEWAIESDRIWLLQSRPITNLLSEDITKISFSAPKPGDKFIRRQVVENMPEPLCPLFDELYLSYGLDKSIGQLMDKFKLDLDYRNLVDAPMFTTINGYAYCRANYNNAWRSMPQVFKWYVTSIGDLFRNLIPMWKDNGLPSYRSKIEQYEGIKFQELSTDRLISIIKELTYADAVYWFDVSIVIGAAKVTDYLLNLFLTASIVEGNWSSGIFLRGYDSKLFYAQRDLEQIASDICSSNQLRKKVNNASANNLLTVLESHDDGIKIKARIQSYLKTYGHQIYNLDFVAPTQIEDPLPVLISLKSLVKSGKFEAEHRQARLIAQRDEAVKEARATFGAFKKMIFDKLLSWANIYGPHREDALFYMGSAWPVVRSAILELGRRLVDRSQLSKPDLVFYLQVAEIEEALKSPEENTKDRDLEKLTIERYKLREARKKLHPPPMIPEGSQFKYGPFDLSAFESQKRNHSDSQKLEGFAVSPGKITGRATVILSPADFEQMQPDTILVCPTTTPAWTPLFSQAKALVTDIGGILAHGSIVAREYGIPAVMGTGVATKRIVSGQIITVCGDSGNVEIQSEGTEILV